MRANKKAVLLPSRAASGKGDDNKSIIDNLHNYHYCISILQQTVYLGRTNRSRQRNAPALVQGRIASPDPTSKPAPCPRTAREVTYNVIWHCDGMLDTTK